MYNFILKDNLMIT